MIELFRLSFRDFWTAKFISLSLLPLFLSAGLLTWLMFFGGGELFSALQEGASTGDYSFLSEDTPYLSFWLKILSFSATKWVVSAFFYILSSFLVVIFSVVIALIVAGFMTPVVTKEINKRHYDIVRQSEISTAKVLNLSLKVVLNFLGILLICLPLLLVPFLNLFIINLPFFYLYYKLLLIDVGSNTLDAPKFELLWLEGGGLSFTLACVGFYLVSLVPLAGLFLQLFFVIFLSHLLYQRQAVLKF
ncbi:MULTISPECIES: EI24 domain-containing protein [Campylobacter]|uniref:EI24 domain-containing protein n=1 Tax=Campylobacter TaxID=194 RepID=UPI001470325C|nr:MULTISPECIES: EI24 domain-containing protein [Campylobacter]MBN7289130.1 EI24 domain-containing protein [Campylobacter curvus]MDU6827925.1 EI24 domain-containing protein [Campylobacter sp.]